MNTSLTLRLTTALTVLVAAVALAACGSNSDSSTTSTAASASGGETVGTASVGGAGNVLVDANGLTLYTPAEEAGGKIECVGACTEIWTPVTASGTPTAAPGVDAKLTTIKRPDGTMQVAADGAPLYTFAEDTSAGEANGNGVTDSFNGKSFTWAVIPAGSDAGSTPPSTTTTQSSGGYSY